MAKLEVQIGADSSELSAEISAAEAKIKRLGALKVEKVKLGLNVAELNSDISTAKTQLANLKKSVDNTGASFGGMAPKVANGGNALMQFSRIAQDAPYGMMGIGNNITATVEAFGHLKQSTGSAGGALKAMAGSIMGTGGILLAVSLVTTAFTYMSMNGISLGDVIDKMTGKFDAFGSSIRKVGEEAAKSSGEEIASMKAMLSVAQDRDLSDKKRLIAVTNLQETYPAYFGNLDKEKILNGEVAGTIDEVSRALIARAQASAIAGKLGELASKRLLLEEKREKAILDIKKSQKDLKDDKSIYNSAEAFNLKAASDSYKSIIQDIKELDSQSKKYSERENASTKESILLYEKKGSAIKASTLGSVNKNTPIGNTPQVEGVQSYIQPLELTPIIDTSKVATSMKMVSQAISEEQVNAMIALNDFNEQLSSIVTNGTVDALAGIGESLGNALASGGNVIDAVGKSILGSMGSMLKELGKATIAYGVGLIAVKAAIKNPYLAVAAGVAMVALGSAMSTAASKSSNAVVGGGGGGSGGSVQGGNSYSSPSSSNSGGGGGSFSGGTVVFEISGQTLIGVLSNTLDRNTRLGGALKL